MLTKKCKIFVKTIIKSILPELKIQHTKLLTISSYSFATSFFSKINLKEKHSTEFKKQKKSQNLKNDNNNQTESSLLNSDLLEKASDLQKQDNLSEKKKNWTSPIEALNDMKKQPIRSEHEIIQLTIGLNVDYRKGDQNVRGIFKMPGGSTKTPKVIAFVPPELADKARSAGADSIGDNETIKEIQNGQINFEKAVCTIEMLPMLKNVGRILGPLGLMPNAKIGTACSHDKLENIIKDLKLGSKEFRVDARGQIIVPIGKRDFTEDNILKNIHSFMTVLIERKPETIKGRYFLYAFINARRLSYKIDMKSLDPKTNSYFMNSIKALEKNEIPNSKINPQETSNKLARESLVEKKGDMKENQNINKEENESTEKIKI